MGDDSVTHFGIAVMLKSRGYKLTRDNYATISNKSTHGKNIQYIQALKDNDQRIIEIYSKVYADEEGLVYSENWCKKRLFDALQNFDFNMEFFKKLDTAKFNEELTRFLNTTDFFEITDLSEFSCPGYYVMVISEYCQIYIGTSTDIKRRIRQHWSGGKMKLDRLLCGDITRSKLSIDSFRALDTTRIFVFPTDNTYCKEDEYITYFSDEFVCNRVKGGKIEFGTLDALVSIKTRDLE